MNHPRSRPLDDVYSDQSLYRVTRENKQARLQEYLRQEPLTPEGYQELVRLLDDLGMTVAWPLIQQERHSSRGVGR